MVIEHIVVVAVDYMVVGGYIVDCNYHHTAAAAVVHNPVASHIDIVVVVPDYTGIVEEVVIVVEIVVVHNLVGIFVVEDYTVVA